MTFTPTGLVLRRRPRATAARVGRRRPFRSIPRVRSVPSVPVRCIEVDTPTGVYLAGRSFIPTHNSSLGRLGLLIHSTAGFVDAGFDGHITLELANVASLPITLYPGMKIGQVSFMQMTTPADRPYGKGATGSKYQGQRGPTPSRYFENFAACGDGGHAPLIGHRSRPSIDVLGTGKHHATYASSASRLTRQSRMDASGQARVHLPRRGRSRAWT